MRIFAVFLFLIWCCNLSAQQKKKIAQVKFNHQASQFTPFYDSTKYYYDNSGNIVSEENYLKYKKNGITILELGYLKVYFPDKNNSYILYKPDKNNSWIPYYKFNIEVQKNKKITKGYSYNILRKEWQNGSYAQYDTLYSLSGKKIKTEKYGWDLIYAGQKVVYNGIRTLYRYDNFDRILSIENYVYDTAINNWKDNYSEIWEYSENDFDSTVNYLRISYIKENSILRRDTSIISTRIYRNSLLFIEGTRTVKDSNIYNSKNLKSEVYRVQYKTDKSVDKITHYFMNYDNLDRVITTKTVSYNNKYELTTTSFDTVEYVGNTKEKMAHRIYTYNPENKLIKTEISRTEYKNANKVLWENYSFNENEEYVPYLKRVYVYNSDDFLIKDVYFQNRNNQWFQYFWWEYSKLKEKDRELLLTKRVSRNTEDTNSVNTTNTFLLDIRDSSIVEEGSLADNGDTLIFTRTYYSKPEKVYYSYDSKFKFILSPNPSHGKITANIYSAEYDELEFVMTDILGRIIYNRKIDISPGPSQIPLLLDGTMHSGTYIYWIKRKNTGELLKGKHIVVME